MYIRKILPYIKKSFCGGIILGTVVCTLGISEALAGICFLPNGEECKSEFSVSSDACKNWSAETRDATCGAKNGYYKQKQAGYNCGNAVDMGDVCCPGWYYCTERNCQQEGYKLKTKPKPESAYLGCEICKQGNDTYYKCPEKPCNYDSNSTSTLKDKCGEDGDYCLKKYADCPRGQSWKAEEGHFAGKEQCGKCVAGEIPEVRCAGSKHWEEELPGGCVTCVKAGTVNERGYYCCTNIEEYTVKEEDRNLSVGACNQYEGPIVATGSESINCYKKVEKDCGNENQYMTSGAEGCYCYNYKYDFDADPTLLKFDASGEAAETGDTVKVTSTRAHMDGSHLEKHKYEILSNEVAAKTGCQLMDDGSGLIQVVCRKNASTEGSRACFVVRHVHTVTPIHPELSKEICIEVEGDKCPGDLVINTNKCTGNDKAKLSETKSVSGGNSCYECLDDSCPDETWTKCAEEGKDCRPNKVGYEISQTSYGNYCYKAKSCENPLISKTEIPSGKENCYKETEARSGDDICFKHKDPIEECKIEDGKVWDEAACDCVNAECESGFSVDAQKAEDCGESGAKGFTLRFSTNPAKSGDNFCTKCETKECSDEFTELSPKEGNWNCTGEGHVCYEGDTAKYNCTCDLEDSDCGAGKKLNKETCECEVSTCPEGSSTTPTPGCYTCVGTGAKSVDESGKVADCLKCDAIKEYTVAEANKQDSKCYEEEVKEGADGTKCFKELKACPAPCSVGGDCVGPEKPKCFNAIWGADEEGSNMWKTADGQIFYKMVPINPCTTEGTKLYNTEGRNEFRGDPDCSCAISQCPVEKGYYDVAPSGCFDCKPETVDGKECMKCEKIADVVTEEEKGKKCYEEYTGKVADGKTKCFKEMPCQGPIGGASDEPTCFHQVWGDDLEGELQDGKIVNGNIYTAPDGEKWYKEVPENPCTSNDPGIKLDPKGGEYTKWDKMNCQCLPNKCPAGTFESESECQKGEGCFTCKTSDELKFGDLTCYERVVMENFRTAEEWTKYESCYNEASKAESANKEACYQKGDCLCPEGTTTGKPKCFDEYATDNNLVVDESRADGMKCYPTGKPKCDESIGEVYDYDKCECVATRCDKGSEFAGTPEGCRECTFTGTTLSDGKGCWVCDAPEGGFMEDEVAGDCVVSKEFKKLDENGATVATTTCYRKGEESTTGSECLIKLVDNDITKASIAFNLVIRDTKQCEVGGSEPKFVDKELPGTYSIEAKILGCEGGKVSFTYSAEGYQCHLDLESAPDCPKPCSDKCPAGEKPGTELEDLTGWKATEHMACNGTDLEPTVNCYVADDEPCKGLTPENEIEGCVTCTYKTSCGGVKHYDCKPMDGYVEKAASEITTSGWDCKPAVVDGKTITPSCCKENECQGTIKATSTLDLTPYVDSQDNCVSYQSTNPKTYSGEDECLKENKENICPNGGEAYETEAAAKAALGEEIIIVGREYACGEKTYTCYSGDLTLYCKDKGGIPASDCVAGCQDANTLKTCEPIDGTNGKCVKAIDTKCAENQQCDGSQDKCVNVCENNSEYTTRDACEAGLGDGCDGNIPVTCTENIVNGITCYKITEGAECTGTCENGQCIDCKPVDCRDYTKLASAPTAGASNSWSTCTPGCGDDDIYYKCNDGYYLKLQASTPSGNVYGCVPDACEVYGEKMNPSDLGCGSNYEAGGKSYSGKQCYKCNCDDTCPVSGESKTASSLSCSNGTEEGTPTGCGTTCYKCKSSSTTTCSKKPDCYNAPDYACGDRWTDCWYRVSAIYGWCKGKVSLGQATDEECNSYYKTYGYGTCDNYLNYECPTCVSSKCTHETAEPNWCTKVPDKFGFDAAHGGCSNTQTSNTSTWNCTFDAKITCTITSRSSVANEGCPNPTNQMQAGIFSCTVSGTSSTKVTYTNGNYSKSQSGLGTFTIQSCIYNNKPEGTFRIDNGSSPQCYPTGSSFTSTDSSTSTTTCQKGCS